MSWLHNDNYYMPDVLTSEYNTASLSRNLKYDTYRSRNPINTNILKAINMLFTNTMRDEIKNEAGQATHTHYKQCYDIIAAPRGQDALEEVVSQINNYTTHTDVGNHIIIINTSTNPDLTTTLKDRLVTSEGYTAGNYGAALTINPYHKTSVCYEINRDASITAAPTNVIIMTTVLSDEFILKLGAVLASLFELPSNESIVQGLLTGDKQRFFDGYAKLTEKFRSEARNRETLKLLDAVQSTFKEQNRARILNDIQNVQANIANRLASLRDDYALLKNLEIKQSSTYWNEVDDNMGALVNYLKANELERLRRLGIPSTNVLDIVIDTTLTYWEEQYYKNYRASNNRNIVTDCNNAEKALLDNIFVDHTVNVLCTTGIRINFKDLNVEKNNDFRNSTAEGGVPHPHIYHYNCWGNNAAPIKEAMKKSDYIIMWEQIKATLSGINLTDSAVFNKFVEYYIRDYGHSFKMFELVDTKEVLTRAEFIARYPEGYHPVAPEVELEPVIVTPKPSRRRPKGVE